MKSNLRLGSNVYLRDEFIPLHKDQQFVKLVRGIPALQKLLSMWGVPPGHRRHDQTEVTNLLRQGWLTRHQVNTIKWELRCIRCDCIPVGITFRNTVEFLCAEPGCAISSTPVRTILIPEKILQSHPPLAPWDEVLSSAIESCQGKPPQFSLDSPRSRIVVRVAPTDDWIYSDDELSCFVIHGLTRMKVKTCAR